jgi:hypothetical protein
MSGAEKSLGPDSGFLASPELSATAWTANFEEVSLGVQ